MLYMSLGCGGGGIDHHHECLQYVPFVKLYIQVILWLLNCLWHLRISSQSALYLVRFGFRFSVIQPLMLFRWRLLILSLIHHQIKRFCSLVSLPFLLLSTIIGQFLSLFLNTLMCLCYVRILKKFLTSALNKSNHY